jgi:hypothetical protein
LLLDIVIALRLLWARKMVGWATSLSEADVARIVEEFALARAVEDCLEAMERGETDLDCLAARYPGREGEVRSLLEIAQHLTKGRDSGAPLSLEFREDLRNRLLSHRLFA